MFCSVGKGILGLGYEMRWDLGGMVRMYLCKVYCLKGGGWVKVMRS